VVGVTVEDLDLLFLIRHTPHLVKGLGQLRRIAMSDGDGRIACLALITLAHLLKLALFHLGSKGKLMRRVVGKTRFDILFVHAIEIAPQIEYLAVLHQHVNGFAITFGQIVA
jgi:hypothetical protein